MIDIKNKIYNALKKQKESVVVDLYLKDYDGANIYIALVYNEKIEKFKVLYVPIDAIRIGDKVEEYFCYQFIFVKTVNYIMELINENEDLYKEKHMREKVVKTNDSYYIELTTHVSNKDYLFNFSNYIDYEYEFLFEIIVILFEHTPHIISELCNKLLEQFNTPFELPKYNATIDFNLFKDDYNKMFNQETLNNNTYTFNDIDFIEQVGNKFCAVIKNKKYIIENIESLNKISIYSEKSSPIGAEVLIIIKAIRENLKKEFNKLTLQLDKSQDNKLLIYFYNVDLENKKFIVLNKLLEKDITLQQLENKLIKITHCREKEKNLIYKYLDNKYENDKRDEIINYIYS